MHWFHRRLERFSIAVTQWAGSSWAFALAAAIVLVWAISGPIFNFSETWQLVINTGTTIVTFLMVFLIQRSQNKESLAVQVKLNELLASQQGASNHLINAEDMTEDQIVKLHERFTQLSSRLDATHEDCQPHSVEEARGVLREAKESSGAAVKEIQARRSVTPQSADAEASSVGQRQVS